MGLEAPQHRPNPLGLASPVLEGAAMEEQGAGVIADEAL